MKPFKILLVEDSEEDYLTLQRALKSVNLSEDIHRVKTGDEALNYVNNEGQFKNKQKYKKPILVLLDLNLPGTDGREVLKYLKSTKDLKKIPIIILTTSGDEKDIEECYNNGANSYLKKPKDFTGFLDLVKKLKAYWLQLSIIPNNY